jgi:hypothetical protein
VIGAHIMGIPVEESVLQLAPVGGATLAAAAFVMRLGLSRMARGFRRDKAA